MITIDENYKGIEKHPHLNNWYIFKGDMYVSEDVTIAINLIVNGYQIVKGNQIVEGSQVVEGSQEVKGYQRVYGYQTVKGYQRVYGDQIVKGYQTVKGYQIVKGCQRVKGDQVVEGNQEVAGNQRVYGDQIVAGNQIVDGYQRVDGYQEVLKKKTNFSLSVYMDTYRIYFYSNLIKIGCQTHSPKAWARFNDAQISKMDEGALDWWKKWKSFVLNTHKELEKVYGKIKDGEE